MKKTRLGRLSILQRWILSLSLSLLPFVGSVVFALWTIDQQSRWQYQLTQQALNLKQLNLKLNGMMSKMERSLKQYEVLKTPEIIELFNTKLGEFKQTQSEILQNGLLTDSSVQQLSEVLGKLNSHLLTAVKSTQNGQPINDSMDEPYALLKNSATIVDQTIESRLAESAENLKTAEWQIVLLGSLIIPLSIVLFVISIKSITRPVQALSSAINLLGRGRWHNTINIEGPADLTLLGERLEWMRLKLKESDEQKKLILRHVTHELKTPLAAIMEAASLLSDEIPGKINSKQAQVLNILKSNSETLNNLIATMLSYNTALVKQSTQFEQLDIRASVTPLIAEFSQSQKQINWKVSEHSLNVTTDKQRLDMILRNLLSNAIYYSGDKVTIELNWYQDNDNWILSVSDNGVGIHADDLGKIFEPFYQGRVTRSGAIKGSGIGLSIVKECVDSMQGNIRVESKPGVGTKFYLTFPELSE